MRRNARGRNGVFKMIDEPREVVFHCHKRESKYLRDSLKEICHVIDCEIRPDLVADYVAATVDGSTDYVIGFGHGVLKAYRNQQTWFGYLRSVLGNTRATRAAERI